MRSYTFDGKVEAAQSVSGERISPTLEDNCARLVHLHDFSHDLTNIHQQPGSDKKISVVITLQFNKIKIERHLQV